MNRKDVLISAIILALVVFAATGWVMAAAWHSRAERATAAAERCEQQLTRAATLLEKAEKIIRELKKGQK